MPPKYLGPTEEEWERRKEEIEELYHAETLDNLIKAMEAKGFSATVAMYKKKFRDWNLRKNLKQDFAIEAEKQRKRRLEGGHTASEILIDGRPVPSDKIDRHLKRYKASGGDSATNTSGVAASIIVQTPKNIEFLDDGPTMRAPMTGAQVAQAMTTQAPTTQAPMIGASATQTLTNQTPTTRAQPVRPEFPSGTTPASLALPDNGAGSRRHMGPSNLGITVASQTAVIGYSNANEQHQYNTIEKDIDIEIYNDPHWLEFGNQDFFNPDRFYTPNIIRTPSFNSYGASPDVSVHERSPSRSVYGATPDANVYGATPIPAKIRQPIHQAAQGGYLKIVQTLLRVQPNCVDVGDANGVTPLMIACFEGHSQIVQALIVAGANVNGVNQPEWKRPIIPASVKGHLECVRLLLEAGAHCNEFELDGVRGLTPLLLASNGGFDQVVQLILSKLPGEYVNAPFSDSQRRPIHQAAQGGHLSTVKVLVDAGANVDQGEKDGATALWLACQDGHTEVVKYLVDDANADVNTCTLSKNIRPIHQAAQNGHLEIVRFLCDRGAEVDCGQEDGTTALWKASQQGFTEITKFLLSKGANPDTRDVESGRYPLHQAAQNGHLEVAAALLESQAKVNSVEEDGWHPLMLAAQGGHTATVELLIRNGAAVDLVANRGNTALWLAAQNGHLETVKMLQAKGASVTVQSIKGARPLHQAAQNGHLEVVAALLEFEPEVNAVEEDGWHPLMFAAQGGYTEIVELLIRYGAAVDLVANRGNTALWLAAQNGHLETVKVLRAKGASVTVQSTNGHQPLHQAAQGGHLEVVKFLVESGAQVNCEVDREGQKITPLWLASQGGHDTVVEFLLEQNASVVIG